MIRSEVVLLRRGRQALCGPWASPSAGRSAAVPKSYVAYTDAHGMAYTWQVPGVGIPLMKKRTADVEDRPEQRGRDVCDVVHADARARIRPGGLKTSALEYAARSGIRRSVTACESAAPRASRSSVCPSASPGSFKSRARSRSPPITNSSGYRVQLHATSAAPPRATVSTCETRAYSGRQTRNSAPRSYLTRTPHARTAWHRMCGHASRIEKARRRFGLLRALRRSTRSGFVSHRKRNAGQCVRYWHNWRFAALSPSATAKEQQEC